VTRLEKLVEQLRNARSGASLADVEWLLLQAGWTRSRQRGSHVVFTKPGQPSTAVPLVHGRKVKQIYVNIVLQNLGQEE
jgi:predicted RNA binding protein YcfA (HicA-like mRNA interferase family)